MNKPLFRDKTTNLIVGGAFFLAGSYFLYCAFDGRGGKAPLLLRPFLPF